MKAVGFPSGKINETKFHYNFRDLRRILVIGLHSTVFYAAALDTVINCKNQSKLDTRVIARTAISGKYLRKMMVVEQDIMIGVWVIL